MGKGNVRLDQRVSQNLEGVGKGFVRRVGIGGHEAFGALGRGDEGFAVVHRERGLCGGEGEVRLLSLHGKGGGEG